MRSLEEMMQSLDSGTTGAAQVLTTGVLGEKADIKCLITALTDPKSIPFLLSHSVKVEARDSIARNDVDAVSAVCRKQLTSILSRIQADPAEYGNTDAGILRNTRSSAAARNTTTGILARRDLIVREKGQKKVLNSLEPTIRHVHRAAYDYDGLLKSRVGFSLTVANENNIDIPSLVRDEVVLPIVVSNRALIEAVLSFNMTKGKGELEGTNYVILAPTDRGYAEVFRTNYSTKRTNEVGVRRKAEKKYGEVAIENGRLIFEGRESSFGKLLEDHIF